eukprot:766898-Hanusia_phi.AAC.2
MLVRKWREQKGTLHRCSSRKATNCEKWKLSTWRREGGGDKESKNGGTRGEQKSRNIVREKM